jgi:hypothetical protein
MRRRDVIALFGAAVACPAAARAQSGARRLKLRFGWLAVVGVSLRRISAWPPHGNPFVTLTERHCRYRSINGTLQSHDVETDGVWYRTHRVRTSGV